MRQKALWALSLAYLLGWGYAATMTSFWGDEEFTAKAVEMPWREMFHFLRGDVHPPLYFIVLKFWSPIFAWLPVEWSLRWFSLLCGLGALWTWRKVFEKLLPDSAAPDGAFFLMAVSPFLGWYATEARMYQFYILIFGLGWLAWMSLMQNPGSFKWRALAGLATAMLPMTQTTALVGGSSIVIWLALGSLERPQMKAAAIALLLACIFYAPQYDTMRYQMSTHRDYWIPKPSLNLLDEFGKYLMAYLLDWGGQAYWLQKAFWAAAFGGFAWSLKYAPPAFRRLLWSCSLGVFVAYWLVSLLKSPFLIPRVSILWVPPLFASIAWAWEKWGSMALGLAVLLALAAPVVVLQHAGAQREDMKGAVEFIGRFAKPGDSVLRASYTGDYYVPKAGLKFSGDGEPSGRRFWMIRRKSQKLAGQADWKQPEAHAEQFKVIARRDFVSAFDDYWTLEVFLVEARHGFTI